MKAWACVAAVALLVLGGGCATDPGPKRTRLTGGVTYDGQPIPYGEVLFTPDAAKQNGGPQGFAQIRDGRYDTASSADGKGVGGGPTILRVTGFSGPGGKLLCEVEMSVEVPADGGTFDIDVPKQTPPKPGQKKPDEI